MRASFRYVSFEQRLALIEGMRSVDANDVNLKSSCDATGAGSPTVSAPQGRGGRRDDGCGTPALDSKQTTKTQCEETVPTRRLTVSSEGPVLVVRIKNECCSVTLLA